MAILETVTDADGRFAFPGWGPRFAFPWGHLKERDPLLLLFKAGYFPKTLENRFGSRSRRWVHTSDWNNTTILLEPASRSCRPSRRYTRRSARSAARTVSPAASTAASGSASAARAVSPLCSRRTRSSASTKAR